MRGRFYFGQRSRAGVLRAIEFYNHALAIDPGYSLAHFYLAHTFSNLCLHDDAEAEMKTVHELDPYSVHYHAIHGQMLYQEGRYEDAAARGR